MTVKGSGNLPPLWDPCGKCVCSLIRGPKVTAATSSLAPKIPLFPRANYNTDNGVSAVCVCSFILPGNGLICSLTGTCAPANVGDAGDTGLIPGSGRSPGGGHGNPLQDSRLENPMDTGAWRATVHGFAKSQTRLSMHTKKKLARKEEMFFSPESKTKLYIYFFCLFVCF